MHDLIHISPLTFSPAKLNPLTLLYRFYINNTEFTRFQNLFVTVTVPRFPVTSVAFQDACQPY